MDLNKIIFVTEGKETLVDLTKVDITIPSSFGMYRDGNRFEINLNVPCLTKTLHRYLALKSSIPNPKVVPLQNAALASRGDDLFALLMLADYFTNVQFVDEFVPRINYVFEFYPSSITKFIITTDKFEKPIPVESPLERYKTLFFEFHDRLPMSVSEKILTWYANATLGATSAPVEGLRLWVSTFPLLAEYSFSRMEKNSFTSFANLSGEIGKKLVRTQDFDSFRRYIKSRNDAPPRMKSQKESSLKPIDKEDPYSPESLFQLALYFRFAVWSNRNSNEVKQNLDAAYARLEQNIRNVN